MLRKLIFVTSLWLMNCQIVYAASISPEKHLKAGIAVVLLIITLATIVAVGELFLDAIQKTKIKIYLGMITTLIILGAVIYYVWDVYWQIVNAVKMVN